MSGGIHGATIVSHQVNRLQMSAARNTQLGNSYNQKSYNPIAPARLRGGYLFTRLKLFRSQHGGEQIDQQHDRNDANKYVFHGSKPPTGICVNDAQREKRDYCQSICDIDHCHSQKHVGSRSGQS